MNYCVNSSMVAGWHTSRMSFTFNRKKLHLYIECGFMNLPFFGEDHQAIFEKRLLKEWNKKRRFIIPGIETTHEVCSILEEPYNEDSDDEDYDYANEDAIAQKARYQRWFNQAAKELRQDVKFSNLLKKNLSLKSFPLIQTYVIKSQSHWNTNNFLININVLRKERLYTKLKYSRTPSYDIASNGSAVFLAGFLAFLVCEKYGIELVDSGDFYYLFMYLVFLSFSIKPLLTSINFNKHWLDIFSINILISLPLLLFHRILILFKIL